MNGADCSFTDELTCNGRKALFDGTCLCSEKLTESTLSTLNETTAGAGDSAYSLYSYVPRDSADGRTGPACEFSNAVTCSALGIALTDGSCICGDATLIVDNNIAFLNTTFGALEFNEAAQEAAQNAARTTTATPSTEAQVEVDCSTVQGLNSHLLRACCNGNCKAAYYKNDGKDDCGDGSDEDGRCGFESSDELTTKATAVVCDSDYRACCNGNCLYEGYKNDGKDDCGDGSDEDGRCGFSEPLQLQYIAVESNCAAPTVGESGTGNTGAIAAIVVLAGGVSLLYILCMIQSIFPWKAPVAKWVLEKLGLLWCFEIDYPTEKDPEARQVEVMTAAYRKSTEKCECTAAVLGCCTIDGPTVVTPGETVEPSTSLFDPMTKLYRCIGLPGTESGCGKWCAVHGPNLDANTNNILCAPGAAIMQNCCGECCAENPSDQASEKSAATKSKVATTSAFGFSDNAPKGTPGYIDVEATNP